MRVLFISSTSFGERCLNAVRGLASIEIVGLLTTHQRFTISYAPRGVTNVTHVDFGKAADNLGCPLIVLEGKLNTPELEARVEALEPDCLLVAGWHHMIPGTWLDRWPTFGLHASLLPKYSGGAPLVWAIINGEKKTGVSLFKFDRGVDTGPIVAQRSIKIRRSDDIASLYRRVERISARLLSSELPTILSPQRVLHVQDDTCRTVFPQRSPDDGQIPWSNCRDIRNFVRAQTRPYPGAFLEMGEERLVIWSTTWRLPSLRLKGGRWRRLHNKLLIRGTDGWVVCGDFSVAVKIVDKWIQLDQEESRRRVRESRLLSSEAL